MLRIPFAGTTSAISCFPQTAVVAAGSSVARLATLLRRCTLSSQPEMQMTHYARCGGCVPSAASSTSSAAHSASGIVRRRVRLHESSQFLQYATSAAPRLVTSRRFSSCSPPIPAATSSDSSSNSTRLCDTARDIFTHSDNNTAEARQFLRDLLADMSKQQQQQQQQIDPAESGTGSKNTLSAHVEQKLQAGSSSSSSSSFAASVAPAAAIKSTAVTTAGFCNSCYFICPKTWGGVALLVLFSIPYGIFGAITFCFLVVGCFTLADYIESTFCPTAAHDAEVGLTEQEKAAKRQEEHDAWLDQLAITYETGRKERQRRRIMRRLQDFLAVFPRYAFLAFLWCAVAIQVSTNAALFVSLAVSLSSLLLSNLSPSNWVPVANTL